MADGIFYPAVSADDGDVLTSSHFYDSKDDLPLGNYGNYADCALFIRFPDVTIPIGATITSAVVKLTAYGSDSSTPVDTNCHFENADNPAAPISAGDYQGRTLTSPIAWDAVAAWTDGTQYDTPELISILQTIINRVGWSSGNAVLFSIENDGTNYPTQRRASSIDYLSGTEKAELHVTWTPETIREISEDINVTSEFDDNFGELDEDININSEFACLVADSPISENISVNSEITYFETDSPISDDVSVNSVFVSEYTGEISEGASVNTEIAAMHQQSGELSEDVSVNSAFACFQRPANLNVELPMITEDIVGGQGAFLNAELPLITTDIKGGAILEALLPVITASLEGIVGVKGDINLILPMPTASITGKVETLGNIDAELPLIRAYMVGMSGEVATLEVSLPMITADIAGYQEITGDLNEILPMIEARMVGTSARFEDCPILRYDDTADILGNLAGTLPIIVAEIADI